MRVALVAVATNKYLELALHMLSTASNRFMQGHEVSFVVFTDREDDDRLGAIPGVIAIHCDHTPWPGPTLRRFSYFASQADRLATFDYVFYVDADMEFVGDVGDEVLGKLVGTLHPYFHRSRRDFKSRLKRVLLGRRRLPFERNPQSLAYVSVRDGRDYYQGCFFGGESAEFVKLAHALDHAIEADLAVDVVAVWHDESHLNRYFVGHPPTVSLSPAYAFPRGSNLPFEPRIQDVRIDWSVYHTE